MEYYHQQPMDYRTSKSSKLCFPSFGLIWTIKCASFSSEPIKSINKVISIFHEISAKIFFIMLYHKKISKVVTQKIGKIKFFLVWGLFKRENTQVCPTAINYSIIRLDLMSIKKSATKYMELYHQKWLDYRTQKFV